MAFTYDLSTDRGRLRLLLADTDSASFIWSDAELDWFLTDRGQLRAAAAAALRSLAVDRARLPRRMQAQGYVTEAQAIMDLRQLADRYDREGGVRTGEIAAASDSLEDIDPEWRRYDDPI